MDNKLSRNYNYSSIEIPEEEDTGLKRGPWTLEEDLLLINYITNYGEGRWNYLACSSGLKRSGKSCRLRWLNYLSPDVRRGNITLEEQLTILQLHFRWGNRWSKIAQHLPGRTDNEIKNYWRTRVEKHAKQMGCDVDSKLFKDTMRYIWIPRLVEKIQAAAAAAATTSSNNTTTASATNHNMLHGCNNANSFTSDNSCMEASSETHEFQTTQIECLQESQTSPSGYFSQGFEFQGVEHNTTWVGTDDLWGNFV